MRIFLTGKTGQLGWELHRQLERNYEVFAVGREDIDFLDSNYLAAIIRQLPKFDLIINAAAYTDVDRAEREPFIVEAVNAEAAAILAAEADFRGIPMIHFSTNYVFDGRRWSYPYRENAPPHPTTVYGWSKHEGEVRIRSLLEKHLIFRLSGLYGIRRHNFFTTMLARNGMAPRVANNQIISPNWTPLVAEAVAAVVKQLLQGTTIPWGTYHLSGGGTTTPYEFARRIIAKVNDLWGGNMPLPIPVPFAEIETPAPRPRYSVLHADRFNKTFQFSLPNWQEQFLHFFGGLNPIGQSKVACF